MTLCKLDDAVHAFVRNPHAVSSLIERLAAAANSRQHIAKAATKSNLAVAMRGHAVLRLQHDCQTAEATAAAFRTVMQKSRSQASHELHEMNSTSAPKKPSKIQALDRDSLGSVGSSGKPFCAAADCGSSAQKATSEPSSDTGAQNLLGGVLDPTQAHDGICGEGSVQLEASTAVEPLQLPEERAQQGALQRVPGRGHTQESSHASSSTLVSKDDSHPDTTDSMQRSIGTPTSAGAAAARTVAAKQRQAHHNLQQKLAGIQPGTATKPKRPEHGRGRGAVSARPRGLPPAAQQQAGVRSSRSKSVAVTSGKGSSNGSKGPQVVPQRQSLSTQQIQMSDGVAAALSDRLSGFAAMVRSRVALSAVSPSQLGLSLFGSRTELPGGALEPFEHSLDGVTATDAADSSSGQDRQEPGQQ